MTFREYKNTGSSYTKLEFANDAGSYGRKGSTIYGYSPWMEEWEVSGVQFYTDHNGKLCKILKLIYPHEEA